MLLREHHFHYGLARSIIILFLLLGGVYILTLYIPSLKVFIAGWLGVPPEVLGASTKRVDPQEQFKKDMLHNFNVIKKQPIRLEDILKTASRAKLMIEDGEGMLKYLQEKSKDLDIPHVPKL